MGVIVRSCILRLESLHNPAKGDLRVYPHLPAVISECSVTLLPPPSKAADYRALAGGGCAAACLSLRGNSGNQTYWITREPIPKGTHHLLNNRQAGRRRGRGGQPPRSNNGSRDNGSRIDNRARGNAPQMLEKYKTLASDAQRQGDRVMTEYYLQFADHYFRIVAEARVRFEETRRPRDDWQDGENEGGDNGADRFSDTEASNDDDGENAQDRNRERDMREPRRNDRNRDTRPDSARQETVRQDTGRQDTRYEPRDTQRNDARNEGVDRSERDERAERPVRAERQERSDERPARPRRTAQVNGNRAPLEDAPMIDISILPPALGTLTAPENESDEAAAPKRRGRPRRAAPETEITAER